MKDMPSRIADAMYRQIHSRGYAAPVDVLMDIGVLDKARYDDWRAGRVPFLEAVCNANLHKLSEMMKEIRSFAAQNGWKPSVSSYKHKGKPLRFLETMIYYFKYRDFSAKDIEILILAFNAGRGYQYSVEHQY